MKGTSLQKQFTCRQQSTTAHLTCKGLQVQLPLLQKSSILLIRKRHTAWKMLPASWSWSQLGSPWHPASPCREESSQPVPPQFPSSPKISCFSLGYKPTPSTEYLHTITGYPPSPKHLPCQLHLIVQCLFQNKALISIKCLNYLYIFLFNLIRC